MIRVTAESQDLKELTRKCAKLGPQGQKAMRFAMKEMRTKGQTIIKKGIKSVYNVDSKGLSSTRWQMKGEGTNAEWVLHGRLLTPQHFSQKPKSRQGGQGSWVGKGKKRKWKPGTHNYTVTMTVLKGKAATIGKYKNRRPGRKKGVRRSGTSPNILKKGGPLVGHFVRGGGKDKFMVFKTMSVPGMATSGRVAPKVLPELQEETCTKLCKKLERILDL